MSIRPPTYIRPLQYSGATCHRSLQQTPAWLCDFDDATWGGQNLLDAARELGTATASRASPLGGGDVIVGYPQFSWGGTWILCNPDEFGMKTCSTGHFDISRRFSSTGDTSEQTEIPPLVPNSRTFTILPVDIYLIESLTRLSAFQNGINLPNRRLAPHCDPRHGGVVFRLRPGLHGPSD